MFDTYYSDGTEGIFDLAMIDGVVKLEKISAHINQLRKLFWNDCTALEGAGGGGPWNLFLLKKHRWNIIRRNFRKITTAVSIR